MSVHEVDNLFSRGLESMKRGNYKEAETFFVKARTLTLEMKRK